MSDPKSPIPIEDRKELLEAGILPINCFPPDPACRFELELREHEEEKTLKMAYTKGEEKEFLRCGEFRFKIDNNQCTLQAYKSDTGEERLFIPFKDTTSGKETYSAGRYIDLDPSEHRTPEGKWILDFNKAYNPWCVYSEMYTCPLIPLENWLETPIHAGEKNYPLKKG